MDENEGNYILLDRTPVPKELAFLTEMKKWGNEDFYMTILQTGNLDAKRISSLFG